VFIAAVNHARQDACRAAVQRLRSLVPKATDVVSTELDAGRLDAAAKVLKLARLDTAVRAS
jgi:hypothetical protein